MAWEYKYKAERIRREIRDDAEAQQKQSSAALFPKFSRRAEAAYTYMLTKMFDSRKRPNHTKRRGYRSKAKRGQKMENGRKLKRFREYQGFKQVEISLISGISQSRLSLIENGWVRPRADEVERIKVAFEKLTKGTG